MAITKTIEPSGIYPVYNDSYLQFTSTLTNNFKAEIQLAPSASFPNKFVVYPDADGLYTFNYREPARVVLGDYPFRDINGVAITTGTWGQSITGSYVPLLSTIEVFSTSSSETTSGNYTFYKSAKQIGEDVFVNTGQISNYSTNGVDYDFTYFEGWQFSFEIQKLTTSDTVHIKNLNTGVTSSDMIPQYIDSAFRIYVDKAVENWTSETFLPLTDNINRLEVYVNDVFKTNINLKKESSRCGVYLKWFNLDGGYSYHLFDEFFRLELNGSSDGDVNTNLFRNVGNLVGESTPIGISATQRYRLKTKVDVNEANIIKSLFASPMVQMYNSFDPYIDAQWLDVVVTSNYSINNKRSLNELVVNIETPQLTTARI